MRRTLTSRPFRIVFAITCIFLAALTYALYLQARAGREADEWTMQSYETLRATNTALTVAIDIGAGVRSYALSGSPEFMKNTPADFPRVNEALAQLTELTASNPAQREALAHIRDDVEAWESVVIAQYNKLRLGGEHPVSMDELRRSDAMLLKVRDEIHDFRATEIDLLNTRQVTSRRLQKEYVITLLTGSGLAFLGLLAANVIVARLVYGRNRVADQLAETQATYRVLLETLNDGVYELHPASGKIVFSESFARQLGYTPTEIDPTVNDFNRLLHPDDHAATWGAIERYAKKEIPDLTITYRMRDKNGRWRWMLGRGVGAWDRRGNLVRLTGLQTDITEQKKREDEVRQLNADLEGFIYIVSHDLRGPLVNMRGFAAEIGRTVGAITPPIMAATPSMTAEDAKAVSEALESDIPEALKFINSGVERMDLLTSSILDLSRAGRRELVPERVDTAKLVERCIHSLAFEIENKGVEIVHDNLPEVVTDAVALEQIFGNILDNAVKYLKPGEPGRIEIEGRQLSWETIFSIKDNGRGISEKDFRKVFDIFRRATNSGDVRGTGMGMAYVKALVRRLGGRIWFESTLGIGTTFYFSVPIHMAASDREAPSAG